LSQKFIVAMFCAVAVTALAADETKTEQLQERASSSDDLQTAAAGEGRSKFFFAITLAKINFSTKF
jgi:hypothetical protein